MTKNIIEKVENKCEELKKVKNINNFYSEEKFMLSQPANQAELFNDMCCKRKRKLIYRPNDILFEQTFTVLGINDNNEEGISIKNIINAEICEGLKQGYLEKYEGLNNSEIKEEYENDTVYEFAEQEFKKMGLIFDGNLVKVYLYDWDKKACHHIGFLDKTKTDKLISFLIEKENYSFDLNGIITGGNLKRVIKDKIGKITVTKEKNDNIGIDLDVSIITRID